jgi:hypothetical protein
MTSIQKQILYGALSVTGLVGTWYFNLQFFQQPGGAGAMRFIEESYATNVSSSITVDITVVAVTFVIWAYFEAKRLAMKAWWVFIPLTFLIALAFAFPLFLLFRERKLAAA